MFSLRPIFCAICRMADSPMYIFYFEFQGSRQLVFCRQCRVEYIAGDTLEVMGWPARIERVMRVNP